MRSPASRGLPLQLVSVARQIHRTVVAGLAAVLTAAVLGACGGSGSHPAAQTTLSTSNRLSPTPQVRLTTRFFAPNAIWNAPLAATAALDPRSTQLSAEVATLARQDGTALSVHSYSVPVYSVSRSQPRVRVVLDNNDPALQAAFDSVPLPADAHPAAGTDAHLTIVQPSTDTMWEFWKLHRVAGGWHAVWGGRMVNVSQNPGYFELVRNAAGQPIEKADWGATATGLPLLGGLILPSELQAGVIHHALSVAMPDISASVRAAPAQRSDGATSSVDAIPEGARFRLEPSLHLAALNLPRTTLIIARAAQRYGMIVRDGGRQVAMFAEDPVNLTPNPYPAVLDGLLPYQVLQDFPWDHLQLMRMTLRSR